MNDHLTVDQFAKLLGPDIHSRRINRLIQNGRLTAMAQSQNDPTVVTTVEEAVKPFRYILHPDQLSIARKELGLASDAATDTLSLESPTVRQTASTTPTDATSPVADESDAVRQTDSNELSDASNNPEHVTDESMALSQTESRGTTDALQAASVALQATIAASDATVATLQDENERLRAELNEEREARNRAEAGLAEERLKAARQEARANALAESAGLLEKHSDALLQLADRLVPMLPPARKPWWKFW